MNVPAIAFHAERKVARLHDPRRGFALVEVESEVRRDPLTGATARICHLALRTPPAPDLTRLAADSATHCPFCPERIETVTPRFPEDLVPGGRLAHGAAVLLPNLFPYDDFSAVAVLSAEHFVPIDALRPALVTDGLAVARDFMRRGVARLAAPAVYGLVSWNYMPASGGSQIHPHMQVVVTSAPGNAVARRLEAAAAFAGAARGPFAAALLEAERGGERWIGEQGRVAWLVPFAPTGVFGDAMCVVRDRATLLDLDDADVDDLAATLIRVLAGFAARGVWSFNLSFVPAAFGAAADEHWLTARLLPRCPLNPKLQVSDASYMQLLLEEPFSMLRPEEVAADLRARFAAA